LPCCRRRSQPSFCPPKPSLSACKWSARRIARPEDLKLTGPRILGFQNSGASTGDIRIPGRQPRRMM
jgi:hypothetical protein